MASLQHIRKRIVSVKNTQQITKAMKMVAAAKFRKAHEDVLAARPFARELKSTLARVAHHKDVTDHPLLARREPVKEDLYVLTSDRGLCGGFNSNVLRALEHFLLDNYNRRDDIRVHTIGLKAYKYCKKNKLNIHENVEGLLNKPNFRMAVDLADDLASRFLAGEVDKVTILVNEFKSAVQQEVVFIPVLPLEAPKSQEGGEQNLIDYLYEPEKSALLDRLVHRYLANQIFMVVLESVASEHGARMSAMENASKNAGEMIENLTLVYNKARQATITKELMEIVSGAEALKD